jgi:hypothetical protein
MTHEGLHIVTPCCIVQVTNDVPRGVLLQVFSYCLLRKDSTIALKCAGTEEIEGGKFDRPRVAADFLKWTREDRTFLNLVNRTPRLAIAATAHPISFAHTHDSHTMKAYVDSNITAGDFSVAVTNGTQAGLALELLREKCAAAASAEGGRPDDLRFNVTPKLKAILNEKRTSDP